MLTAPVALQVGDDIVLTIAGNKGDLERQRVVSKQEGMDYAASAGATYYETSAKLGRGIDEVFQGMGKRLLQTSRGGGGDKGGSGGDGDAGLQPPSASEHAVGLTPSTEHTPDPSIAHPATTACPPRVIASGGLAPK